MSTYGQRGEPELHERLTAYIHGGGGDWGNDEDFETNAPGSPDPLFDSPGPSNIASAFAAAASASNHVRTRTRSTRRSTRPGSSGALAETEDQDGGNTDNDGWTDTDSVASRASSVRPDATSTAGAGRTGGSGGARRVGGRPAAGAPSMGFGMGEENPVSTVSNVAVPYTCWSCSAMVSIRRKESLVMCSACGGRVVMKVRPEQTVIYSTM